MSILQHIHIKSFKSIQDQKIQLGQLNVFIGTNGAGKSNLLEAVGMLSAAATGEIDYNKLAERGVRLSSPEVFRSAFSKIDRKMTFFLEAGFKKFLYHANITSLENSGARNEWGYHAERLSRGSRYNTKIAGRSNRIAVIQKYPAFDKAALKRHQSIIASVETLGGFSDSELDSLNALRDFSIYSPSTPILRGVSNDESHKVPLGIYGGSLAKALNEILLNKSEKELDHIREFFKLLDWFSSVGSTKPDPLLQSSHVHTGPLVVSFKDKFMPQKFKGLYAYDVSEGALYVLFVLVLLVHPKAPSIFALDNVDNALNPGLVTSLINFISDFLGRHPNKQVLMTTHNPTTLDALDLFNLNHRLFVVQRDRGGATVFERITPPDGMTREQWQEKYGYMKLSEVWLSGVLKGINPPPTGF
ncbi:AAA family ATPase [Candidatus Nomurabacteria bacterium]|nr:AAA family ATPase [Candidatus Nomurabacteria bacterium]